MNGDTCPESLTILWADVGERLGLDKTGLRSLRTAFSDVLGLDNSKAVSSGIVPVLAKIEAMRRQGTSDAEIREKIGQIPKGREWPEEVLARMEQAATASAALTRQRWSTLLPEGSPATEAPIRDVNRAATPYRTAEAEIPAQSQVSTPDASPFDAPALEETLSEETLREIVFDLRRAIATDASSERELVLQLMQCVRKLALEVRDLRYAFLLASSRKDRKKGLKTISRLLSS